MAKKNTPVDFKTAFMFPFNRAKGMLNILWILLPIIGWFALGGYGVRIVQGFVKGKFKELPLFNFNEHLKLGFFMFLKGIPFIVAYGILSNILGLAIGIGTALNVLISIFIVPILTINFLVKEKIEAYFEFAKLKPVFTNLGDYIIAILKSLGLGIIFVLMFVILVGIPANSFTKNLFIADFYRRKVK